MKRKPIALALGASVAASASLCAAISSEKYVYDASGNVVEKRIGEQVTRFDYDGNLLKESVLNASQIQYLYDEAGRLIAETEEDQVIRKLYYQFADKVIRVKDGRESTELFYNAEGQLVGTSSGGNLKTIAWDGLAIVSRGEDVHANEEHRVGGVPVLVGEQVSVFDMLGTTLSIGNKAMNSSAFGEGMSRGLFTGKPYVEAIDGFVFKHRSYSASRLRWNSADPLGFPDGPNNFEYVSGNPLGIVDPDGLAGQIVDPLDDPLFAPAGWEQYKEFWNARDDHPLVTTTNHTGGGWPTDQDPWSYPRKYGYEFKREDIAQIEQPIPRGDSITMSSSTSKSKGSNASVNFFETVSIGISEAAGQTHGITVTVSAPDKPGLYKARGYREEVYRLWYLDYGNGFVYSPAHTAYQGGAFVGYTPAILGDAIEH
ncbi:MAG: RHS repeat-associated core domain-containing protein [Verrucomicrobiota bacterium JB023]|nr:RHS repeat-associated core domain-containing protein [Verrucomicrobiota bacterium JB023]